MQSMYSWVREWLLTCLLALLQFDVLLSLQTESSPAQSYPQPGCRVHSVEHWLLSPPSPHLPAIMLNWDLDLRLIRTNCIHNIAWMKVEYGTSGPTYFPWPMHHTPQKHTQSARILKSVYTHSYSHTIYHHTLTHTHRCAHTHTRTHIQWWDGNKVRVETEMLLTLHPLQKTKS